MADIYSKKKRSKIMSKISGRETKPEILVRRYLFSKGYRYRKNDHKLPGKPDIVLSKYKSVIFIHGCFWHGHTCKKASRPTSNVEFWNSKIERNIERDKEVKKKLLKLGWRVITIWDCELKSKRQFDNSMNKLLKKLNVKVV
ncbi:MAG: DNA mismatch endonuclease Vsr [Bacteroidales bacterium]